MNKFESGSILPLLKNQIATTFAKDPFLVIGVSGGADSMALLYALHKLEVRGLVVHVNYSQRGKESEQEQEMVEQVSAMWGFECCSIRPDSITEGENFQNWARQVRYDAFEDLRKAYDADGIAVAHHQDDQLETILFKVLRGSGLAKLSGMHSWDAERFIWRPFLSCSKEELIAYCENEHVPYKTDASNLESKYARNAIRNEVFPVFEQFIPGWKENLLAISKRASVFDESIETILGGYATDKSISIEALSAFSDHLKGALLKRFVEQRTDATLTKGNVGQLISLLESETGKRIEIDENTVIIKDREVIRLISEAVHSGNYHRQTFTEHEAELGVSVNGWRFSIHQIARKTGLYVDADALQWPLTCRKWVAGDAFVPLGMSGSQKISDHLTNRKIKSALRQESLILSESDSTICAILYPEPTKSGQIGNIAESCKETESTKRYLCIEKI